MVQGHHRRIASGSTALHENKPWLAVSHLRRSVAIEDLLLGHLRVLESMSPEGFLEFRDPLNPASGFQSFQFRAIEFLSGAGKKAMLSFELFDESQRSWLRTSVRPQRLDRLRTLDAANLGRSRTMTCSMCFELCISITRLPRQRVARRGRTLDGSRRSPRDVAPSAHDDGGTSNRTTTRNRGQRRNGVPRHHDHPASLPPVVGSEVGALILRDDCEAMDDVDDLRDLRSEFRLNDGEIYLDGNSLGPLVNRPSPRRQVHRNRVGEGHVRSWNNADWMVEPTRIGDNWLRS